MRGLLRGSSRSALWEIWESSLEEVTTSKALQVEWGVGCGGEADEGARAAPRLSLLFESPFPNKSAVKTRTGTGLAHSGPNVEKRLGLQGCVWERAWLHHRRRAVSPGRRDPRESICEPETTVELFRAS